MDFITQISKFYDVLTRQHDAHIPEPTDPLAQIPRERQRLARTDPLPDATPLDVPQDLGVDHLPLDLRLVSAGLTPPVLSHASRAEPFQLHVEQAPVFQIEGHPEAGTVMTAAVFNAAFLPVLPVAQIYKPTSYQKPDATQSNVADSEAKALEYLANLGLNAGLIERLRTAVQFAKTKGNFLIWLSTFTKVVMQILRTLRRETPDAAIKYEDELDVDPDEDRQNPTRKRRRILKI